MLRNVPIITCNRRDGIECTSRILTSGLGCGGGSHAVGSFPESIYSKFTGTHEKKSIKLHRLLDFLLRSHGKYWK